MTFTVGHSTRSAEEFVALLRENDVELLVDVRRHPGSRRHPQFNRGELEETLAEDGRVVYPGTDVEQPELFE